MSRLSLKLKLRYEGSFSISGWQRIRPSSSMMQANPPSGSSRNASFLM
jgi:hypothetical protein